MNKQNNSERKNIVLTTNFNHLKWKNFIRSKLAENWDNFIEIPMDKNNTTIIDTNIVFDLTNNENFTNIGKNELIFLLKEVCKEYTYNYFITTRSMYDSDNYYIVLTLIH